MTALDRYCVHGSTITSRNDGQTHFVSAQQVADLYRFHPSEWVSADASVTRHVITAHCVFPDYWGRYDRSILPPVHSMPAPSEGLPTRCSVCGRRILTDRTTGKCWKHRQPAPPEGLRDIVLALRRKDMPDGPCWCSVEPNATNMFRHERRCRSTRAALARQPAPSEGPAAADLKDKVRQLAHLTPEDWKERRGGDPIARTINAVFDIIDEYSAVQPAPSEGLRAAIEAALLELGVPDEDYPAPVANAVTILRDALARQPAPSEVSDEYARGYREGMAAVYEMDTLDQSAPSEEKS